MDLKIGAKVMVYSRSQNKLCPARIIGLKGDHSKHPDADPGQIIEEDVEIQYLPPCPSIIKDVNISELKFTYLV